MPALFTASHALLINVNLMVEVNLSTYFRKFFLKKNKKIILDDIWLINFFWKKILPMLKKILPMLIWQQLCLVKDKKKSFQKKTILLCFKIKTKRPLSDHWSDIKSRTFYFKFQITNLILFICGAYIFTWYKRNYFVI